MVELLAIGEDIPSMPPKELFERGQLYHIATFELYVFLLVQFGMEEFYEAFVFQGFVVENLKEWFHVEVPDFHQGVVQGSENIKNLVSGFVLGGEESVTPEEVLS